MDAIDRMIVPESVGGGSGASRRPVVEDDSASDLDDGFDDNFADESGDEQDDEDDGNEEEEERGNDTDEEEQVRRSAKARGKRTEVPKQTPKKTSRATPKQGEKRPVGRPPKTPEENVNDRTLAAVGKVADRSAIAFRLEQMEEWLKEMLPSLSDEEFEALRPATDPDLDECYTATHEAGAKKRQAEMVRLMNETPLKSNEIRPCWVVAYRWWHKSPLEILSPRNKLVWVSGNKSPDTVMRGHEVSAHWSNGVYKFMIQIMSHPFWRKKEWFMVLCIQYAVIVRTNDIRSWEMPEDVPETFFSVWREIEAGSKGMRKPQLHAKVKETMEERGYLPTQFSDIFDAIEVQVATWKKSPRAAVVLRGENMRGDEWKTPLRLYGVKTDDLTNLVRALDNMVVHGNVVNIPAESIAHCYKTARPQGRQTNEAPSDLDVITSFRDDILLSEIRYVTRLKLEKGCYDEHRDEQLFPDMTEFAPAEAVLEEELEDEAATGVPVKRKPGRPRMSEAQKRVREEVAEASGESPAKRKRGRPVTKSVAAAAAAPAAAKGEKRGRGRPRKYLEVVRVPVTAPTPEDDGGSLPVDDDQDIGISRNGGGPAGKTADGADANGGGAEGSTGKAGHDVEASVSGEAGNIGKPNPRSLSFMLD
ncbi:uncharacterized protein PG986_009701 [Apiospora aurea]|uniref:Uncharacterized protein n=1 Tax=Apiospora aurea TaxID=335848 RepID=A0ABR1Q8F2_9PEZI